MKCGHRGKPSRNEERLLENLIRESGFLDSNIEEAIEKSFDDLSAVPDI